MEKRVGRYSHEWDGKNVCTGCGMDKGDSALDLCEGCLPTTCQEHRHNYKEEYYGYRCLDCNLFIAFGCEPWLPTE